MVKKLTYEDLSLKTLNMHELVQLGGLYRHLKSGDYYVVKSLSLREADLEPVVSYSPLTRMAVEFSRPMSEWLERYERQQQG